MAYILNSTILHSAEIVDRDKKQRIIRLARRRERTALNLNVNSASLSLSTARPPIMWDRLLVRRSDDTCCCTASYRVNLASLRKVEDNIITKLVTENKEQIVTMLIRSDFNYSHLFTVLC